MRHFDTKDSMLRNLKIMFLKTNSSCKGMSYLFLLFVLINFSINTVYSQDNCCGPGKGDRVKAMTLKYTGQDCSASSNNQGPIGDKWDCTGNPANDAQVYIVVNDKNGTDIGGSVYFTGNVNLNAAFSAVSGNEMKSSVYIHIFNQQGGTQVQLLKIQAHCSVPIASGNQFGSIVIQDITFKNNFYCAPADPCSSFNPIVSGNGIVCDEDPEPVVLTASGGTSYLWNTGATSPSITVSPAVKTTYSVTVTGPNNCVKTVSRDVDVIPCSGKQCFSGNSNIGAEVDWKIVLGATPEQSKVNIRVTYSKNFVDNTYGTNAVGWPNGHTFNNLVGSDQLRLALYDRTNTKQLEFEVDYITASTGAPSGYDCLGVTGGEGGMIQGNVSDVLSATTSLDVNLNDLGYVLTVNSPATDASYTPNPQYPGWIYDVWYEVEVKLSAFGPSGYGKVSFLSLHASPSKTGNNTEPVTEGDCCALAALIEGDNVVCQGETTALTAGYTNEYSASITSNTDTYLSQASTGLNYGNCNRLYTGSTSASANRSLIKFTLPDIPANAVIISAKLTMNKTGGASNAATGIALHQVLSDWTEGGGSCSGSNGAASWNLRQTGTSWSKAGGDFATLPASVVTVGANGAYDFDVTGIVSSWVNGSAQNYGVLLKILNEGAANEKYFASGENNTTALRPTLNIVYTVPPATSGITYRWSNGATTPSITVAPPSTTNYNVTITDSGGCRSTATIAVLVNPLPSANAGPDVLICTEDFAYLNASANGGTLPYTYQWNNPPSNGPVKSVNPVQTTNYTVTVTDALGCRDTDDVTVQVGQKPAASAVNDGPVTCAKTTATLTAFPASGVTYFWSNGAVTRSTTVSSAGTYTVTVTDIQSACTSTAQTTVTGSPQKPEMLLQNDGPLTCAKTSMIITAVTTGGNPPFTYQWNNNLGSGPLKNVSPQVTTTYRVTVTDALGCTDEEAVTVTPLSRPIASAVNDGPITCIKTSVNITASPASGVAYLWNTGSTSRSIFVSTTGTYTVTVTDLQSGCTSAAASTVVGDPGRPALVLVNDGPVDCIKTSATITASATGGNAPYQYLWSNNLGTGPVKVVSPSQTTTYSVTVTDVLGCTDSKSTTVTVLNKPVSSAVNDGPLTCAKTSVTLTAFPAIGVTYLWSNGGTSRTTKVNAAGSYSVTVTDLNSGCTSAASTTVAGDPTSLQVSIRIDDEPDCDNPSAILTAIATGATPPVQFVWNQNLGKGAVKTVTPTVPTTYQVTVTDGLGCSGTASVELQPPGRAKVGDFVWEDKNANGCQDVGEPGVSGVSVKIYRSGNNMLISETTTNASGYYEFDVCAGTYYIVFGTWQNYERTAENACDDTKDSDANRSTGKTPDFTLRTGDFNRTIDAGFFNCIQVEMLVWYDINKNDLWDTNENGINQLQVKLWRKYGNEWRVWDVKYTGPKPGTPSDDGYCKFCPPSGDYYIEVVMPPLGLVRVRPNIGDNELIDSDLTNAFGPTTTDVFQVLPGMPVNNLAGGFYPMATAGNLVWVDSNLNGVQDVGEQKMPGILVEAYDVNTHEKLREAETNENGEYLMDYLEKRNVYLKFYPPQGYGATLARRVNDVQDSDVDHTFGPNTTRSFSMTPGMNNPQIDMGVAFGFLPVDWVDVYAVDKGKKNEIHWIVENEVNVSHYVVEKLHDETQAFEPASGEIKASGLGKRTERYMTYDENAQNSGVYIYRIRQVDFDGRETNSKQVRLLKNVGSQIEILPNPVKDQASIGIYLHQHSRVNVSLFDAYGRRIMVVAEDAELGGGKHELKVDVGNILSGMYYIKCEIDGEISHIPLMRMD